MELVRHLLPFGQSQGYANYPLRWLQQRRLPTRYFDLIFGDGRSRCDCITVAALVLAEGGTVVVHDAQRDNYRTAFSLFAKVDEFGNTAFLSDSIR